MWRPKPPPWACAWPRAWPSASPPAWAGNPGVLRRCLEVLELLAEGRTVEADLVDKATFRLGEQNAFAWSRSWQTGSPAQALPVLRQALEDDPGGPSCSWARPAGKWSASAGSRTPGRPG